MKALQHTATALGRPLRMLDAVEAVNDAQKLRLVEKIVARLGDDLAGRTFALWGLAFKPNTDDMREAPSREIVAALAARGARVVAYDPVAMPEAKRVFGDAPHLSLRHRRRWPRSTGADALRGRHRVEGIPQPRFRRDPRAAEAAARVRRPQPLRARAGARRGPRVFRHRPPLSDRHADASRSPIFASASPPPACWSSAT